MSDDRTRFTTASVAAAGRIAEILDRHPVLGGQAYPLPSVLHQLAEHHSTLQRVVADYPLPLAVAANGGPDRLCDELAALMGFLQRLLVLYRNLDDIPDRLRTQLGRDLSATHQLARKVRDIRRRR
ncbi:hypothetical protein [Actinoalloteichus hymeniacidonis]|uniref:Uncharacterized protein n=1 Tax=Actinoalloteichus hymeniacidonis TaxID=340345 RepID=A0AAC9MYS7_9PSEU|nr:hypothetical protein [Actinoalloteichus hymeniacidonis]AOS64663.1 hypothetical protein TL08_19360 [Actinoalloteichus hymeniacidonis]MBB5907262.1 hypothetical protein [Actinoalloteichus hymeniacidonis]